MLSVCPSVRPSVRDVEVRFSHRLEYFKNNSTAEYLKAFALGTPNMGYLVRREHPQNWGLIGLGSLCMAENLQYLRNGARYDQGYYYGLIGTHTRAFDWYQNR